MNTNTIQQEIQKLRKRWKEEPENRKIIELQAKALKRALETPKQFDIVDEARKIFLNDEKMV